MFTIDELDKIYDYLSDDLRNFYGKHKKWVDMFDDVNKDEDIDDANKNNLNKIINLGIKDTDEKITEITHLLNRVKEEVKKC